ncbi:MAG: Hsp20/alpha crystallin family protein [Candidatus Kerfeldbacteria bacterium]|nr:Hsp20/alpha crystallin family protein [Candidatus Kerfeldbacteria bacterium]
MPKKEKVKSAAKAETDYVEKLAAAADEAKEHSAGWIDTDYSGQLAVDVFEDGENNIVIRAAIAGVRAEDIDITVNDDMVTIKGVRHVEDEQPIGEYLYEECYWGGFSRTIILPVEVDADAVKATLKSGILRVVLPKVTKPSAPAIEVQEEGEE